MPSGSAHIETAASIVSAYVGHSSVRPAELPDLIASVHASLARLGAPPPVEEPAPELKPAVPIRKSITRDYLISLEDGRQYKTLKRHLSGRGMTPAQYRSKWGLPDDYPMVSPGYTAQRSELARTSGLGSRRRAAVELAGRTTPVEPESPTLAPVADAEGALPKRRGRPRKAT